MADDEKGTENKAMEALEAKLASLEARLEAESGKSAGILDAKKKAQEKAEALQAKIDELESKDLGEVDKMKIEMERMQSRVEAAEAKANEAEQTLTSTQRKNALNDIGKKFKWLDSVPEALRSLTLDTEFTDIDLGNEVLVNDKVKTMTESYAGLLSADVANGAGAKPGDSTPTSGKPNMENVLNTSDADILADPAGYLAGAIEANQ